MSAILNFLYNLPASLMQAMSPSMFTRFKNRLSSTPTTIEPTKTTPEEEARDKEEVEKVITNAVCCTIYSMNVLMMKILT